MRWFLLLVSLSFVGLMFFAPSPAWVGLGVLGFLVASVSCALAFAQERLSAASLPDRETSVWLASRSHAPRSMQQDATAESRTSDDPS